MNIAELRRLEAEATPGKWEWYDLDGFVGVTPVDDDEADIASTCEMIGNVERDRERALANAAFIATIRNALPELLKALEEAQAENASLRRVNRALGNMLEPHGGVDVG